MNNLDYPGIVIPPDAPAIPTTFTDETKDAFRFWVTYSLFYLCQILFEDVTEEPHGPMCRFMEDPGTPVSASDYKLHRESVVIVPNKKLMVGARGILKSSIKQARLLQLGLQNSEIRVLDVLNVLNNAENDLAMVRGLFDHPLLLWAFPDVIPNEAERRTKWLWSKRGFCLKRKGNYPEPTYTAAGLGTNLTSRHYNVIAPDDIVVAKTDNLTAEEIRPNPMDIQKAIGWHKVQLNGLIEGKPTHRGNPSVLYPPQILNLNNRWCNDDYVDFVERYAPEFEEMVIPLRWPADHPTKPNLPSWPSGPRGTAAAIEKLEAGTSTYIFNTQHLCVPSDPKEQVFHQEWLNYYVGTPDNIINTVAIMDPALSLDKSACFTAVVVVSQVANGDWYIRDAIRGHVDTKGQLDYIFNTIESYKDQKLSVFAVEDVLFQEKILDCAALDPRYVKLMEYELALIGIKPLNNERKEQRIESLQPRFRSGRVHMLRAQVELINELLRYRRRGASTKDLVDALSYIPRLLYEPEGLLAATQIVESEPGTISFEEVLANLNLDDDNGGILGDVYVDNNEFIDQTA